MKVTLKKPTARPLVIIELSPWEAEKLALGLEEGDFMGMRQDDPSYLAVVEFEKKLQDILRHG